MEVSPKPIFLLVKIEGPGAGIPSIIIYLLLKGFLQTPPLINKPMGIWDIYGVTEDVVK